MKIFNRDYSHYFGFFIFYTYRVPIRDTDELRKRLVATWAKFSTAWWTMQLISGKKDWKHVSVQKVVTLNICCNVACLTFHLPHITTGFFSEPPMFQGMQHTFNEFSQMKKLMCILQGSAVTFFQVCWVRGNSLFSSEIIWSMYEQYCWKWLLWISQGKVATVYRWGGKMYKLLMSNFLRI